MRLAARRCQRPRQKCRDLEFHLVSEAAGIQRRRPLGCFTEDEMQPASCGETQDVSVGDIRPTNSRNKWRRAGRMPARRGSRGMIDRRTIRTYTARLLALTLTGDIAAGGAACSSSEVQTETQFEAHQRYGTSISPPFW